MTWTELVGAIEGQLPIVGRGEDWLGLRWTCAPPLGQQSQRIQLVASRSSGLLVLVVCELGSAATAASARLLEINMTMRRGAAALYRGRGVLRFAAPLEGLEPEVLIDTASYLAETARRIRLGLVRDSELHGHFAE